MGLDEGQSVSVYKGGSENEHSEFVSREVTKLCLRIFKDSGIYCLEVMSVLTCNMCSKVIPVCLISVSSQGN